MNILWIYNRPLNPESGGTERITSLVAKGLISRGHNCLGILVFDEHSGQMLHNGKTVEDLFAFLREQKVDAVINQIAYSQWLLDAFLKAGGTRWRQEGGLIVSCLHFDPKNPSLLYMLSGKQSKTVRDWLNIAKAALLFPYYKRLQENQEGDVYNYIYDNSDRFVVLSETHIPYLHNVMRRADYDKLEVINNPLTFDDISDVSILPQKKKIALVCARMSEYHKRISLVLKSWRYLQENMGIPDWTLVLLGDGPDLDRYKKYVLAHKMNNVVFEGQKSPEPYYREASILLLTSSAEGWGLTITEGLQRGVVPVVMESCPVFREIINDGENGFLTKDRDVKEFADRIWRLAGDANLLNRMQENVLESSYRFSLDLVMDSWERILISK